MRLRFSGPKVGDHVAAELGGGADLGVDVARRLVDGHRRCLLSGAEVGDDR